MSEETKEEVVSETEAESVNLAAEATAAEQPSPPQRLFR